MFPDKERDFVAIIDSDNIVLIKELEDNTSSEYLDSIAQSILDTIRGNNADSFGRSKYGCRNHKQCKRAYKEAQICLGGR